MSDNLININDQLKIAVLVVLVCEDLLYMNKNLAYFSKIMVNSNTLD